MGVQRSVIAVLVALVVLLTGCVPQDGDGPDGAIIGADGAVAAPAQVIELESAPLTASQALAVRISEEIEQTGAVSLQSVIDAFDLTFGPMPGATATDGDRGDGLGGSYVGLLASMDGNAGNDLLLPDGSPLPVDASLEDVYAQAWLVTEADTLFDYRDGESPDFFHHALPPLGATMDGLLDFFDTMNGAPPDDRSAEAFDRCEDELGPGATTFEVESCAYDVLATGDSGFLGAYGTTNELRLDSDEFAWLWEMYLPGNEPRPGVTEPVAGEPSLVLDAENPAGTVRVPEGAVVSFRTGDCGAALVRVTTQTHAGSEQEDTVGLCADDTLNSIFGSGRAIDGEAYGIASDAGAYVFRLDQGAPPGTRVEITVDVDPFVELFRANALRFDGRVRQLGDAQVFVIANPRGESWNQTGVGRDACVLVVPTFQELGAGTGFHSLGAECIQEPAFAVTATFGSPYPAALVVVARTDEPTRFSLQRGG